MYNGEAGIAKQEKQPPVLFSLKEQFEKELIRQGELLNTVQSKMHNLLNKRIPEKDPNGPGNSVPIENDFVSAMNTQFNRLIGNNQKIEQILTHLDQIL